jgi:outer membrane cobalamin receptor
MACSRPRTGGPSDLPHTFFVLSALLLFSLQAPLAARSDEPARGRVVDPDGRPVAGALVMLDGPLGAHAVRTDGTGGFTVPASPAAAYRVRVMAPGLEGEVVTLRMPSDSGRAFEVTLHVAPVSEAIVVSASQVPRPLSEAPATATVVSRADIERRQLETVSDALRTVPGFTVARSGGRGTLTSVFPRGGESDYTLVLVDGMRVNTFGGGFDFSLLPFGNVEQVEIVRGPESAIFGSDAIGGIVQVTTRHDGPAAGSASFDGGSQRTLRGRAGGSGSLGRWSFGGGVEGTKTDGYTGLAPASGEVVSNDDWRSTTAAASVGWTKSPATAVRGDLRWLDAERGNPGPFGSDPIGAFPGVNRVARGADTDRQASISAHLPWGHVLEGRVRQRLQASVSDLENRYHDTFGDSIFKTRRVTARAQTDLVATASTGVSFGVEALGERARSTFVTGEAGEQVPITRRVTGVFAEVRQDVGRRASVTAGVRLESIRRAALEADPNPYGPRPAFPLDTVTSVNPRVAASVALWQDTRAVVRTRLHASAGTGIRPPDAFETAFTDNPSLAPERSRSVDVGVTHTLTDRLETDVTFFDNHYDDLIVAVGSLSDVSHFRTDNISNARARGLEVSASWRGRGGLVARTAYTWLDTTILAVDGSTSAPPPFTVGDPLVRRPRHQGSVGLEWSGGRVSAFGEARARGSVLDLEPNYGAFGGLFRAPGFVVVDAGGAVGLRSGVDVFARGLNLLDRRYEEVYGYPALGRSVMVGVKVALRP